MSMLNQLPSSRNNSLNHLLDWEKVFEQCKSHQDNNSDKDSKYNLQSVIKIFLHLPNMTHIQTWTRYHQYKHSD